MKPLLRHVRTLTLSPARAADAEAALAAGWDEKALHDAVSVCALFNLMNRLVDGLGVTAGEDYFATSAHRLADAGLRDLLKG